MGGAVKKAVRSVSKVVSKVSSGVQNAVANVIKNPLPVIETLALQAVGVPAPIASAAVSAANGGNVKDIATAAATSFAGEQVGKVAGSQAAAATQSKTIGMIAAASTGASTQVTLTGLAQGKGLQDSLSAGLKAATVAGLTQATIEQISPTTGPAPVEERSVGVGTETPVSEVAVGDVSAEIAAAEKAKPEQYVQLPTEQKLLAEAISPKISSSLFGSSSQPFSPAPRTRTTTAEPVQQTASPTQTQLTYGPGSQALAQALRVGDVGAPIFGGDKEGGKKSGWNVESLRYMGNSEA